MKVMKFGGSSLANATCLRTVSQLILDEVERGQRLVIVVSAYEGVTEQLIEIAETASRGQEIYLELFDKLEARHVDVINSILPENELRKCIIDNITGSLDELGDVLHGVFLLKELSAKSLDFIMSFGEMLSAYTLAELLKSKDSDAEFLDMRQLIKTDSKFGDARVYFERTYQNILTFFNENETLQIATGFIASTFNNETITLGRGASDYTAAIIGRALEVDHVEIWTDVDGVMTADPRKVSKAFPIAEITYEETMEMSHFGAKVLHPPTMAPLVKAEIPIHIKNTFGPNKPGSVIKSKASSSDYDIRGISSIDNISLLRIQGGGMVGIAGISKRLFSALAKRDINIILITQASSEHSICIAVEPKAAHDAKREIEEEFSLEIYANQIEPVCIEEKLSIVAVVGENMRSAAGVCGRVFSAIGRNGINISAIAQGSSELNISCIVHQVDVIKALNVIHDEFFFAGLKPLHLFILGVGLVGTHLIEQIASQEANLASKHRVEMRLVGLANSQRMIFNEQGISLSGWKERLNRSNTKTDIAQFVKEMAGFNLRNTVFLDCTASGEVPLFYEEILRKRVSIVTPNKMGTTGSYEDYRRLKFLSKKWGVKYLYETNVGAGLPIIGTINDLMNSGDKMLKIEAIVSGTLSFIFNRLSATESLSALIAEGAARGYTEPDPRSDLNGVDVQRKILILARECGLQMEMNEVKVEALLPKEAYELDSVEEFMLKLKDYDVILEKRRAEAESRDCALRYVAVLEDGKAEVKLIEVGRDHPFYSLSETDNIIAITTDRYKETPLVIRGPGAGGAVTAAGVFADVMLVNHEWA